MLIIKQSLFILCGIVFGIVLCLASHLGYLYFHQQFKPEDFKHGFVFRSDSMHIAPKEQLKEEASKILDQKFSYVGHGHQMTAFESEDHQYVIKLFNPRPALNKEAFHSVRGLKHMCSLKWISDAYLKRRTLLTRLIASYKIAFEELKEETGLVYIHFDNSTCLSKRIHLSDKEGREDGIELANVPFILQKKAEIAADYLGNLLQRHEIEKAKKALHDLYAFFEVRAKKGITDRQQTLYNNYGFIGERVVQIDVGRIRKDEQIRQNPEEEIKRVFGHINKFLSAKYPQLVPFFLQTSEPEDL